MYLLLAAFNIVGLFGFNVLHGKRAAFVSRLSILYIVHTTVSVEDPDEPPIHFPHLPSSHKI